jgi:hypothetical protein
MIAGKLSACRSIVLPVSPGALIVLPTRTQGSFGDSILIGAGSAVPVGGSAGTGSAVAAGGGAVGTLVAGTAVIVGIGVAGAVAAGGASVGALAAGGVVGCGGLGGSVGPQLASARASIPTSKIDCIRIARSLKSYWQ